MTLQRSVVGLVLLVGVTGWRPLFGQSNAAFEPRVPRTWDDAALADWATPVAGLNVRPDTHDGEANTTRLPIENYADVSGLCAGQRAAAATGKCCSSVGPKPLIEPRRTLDRIRLDRRGAARYSNELDHLALRTLRSQVDCGGAQSPDTFDPSRTTISAGRVKSAAMRWVPTSKRGRTFGYFKLFRAATWRSMEDGSTDRIGAPARLARPPAWPDSAAHAVHQANRLVPSAIPFRMGDEPLGHVVVSRVRRPMGEGRHSRAPEATMTPN